MFFKLIKLFFLFCIFLVVVFAFLLQTEFSKEKIKNYLVAQIEKRSGLCAKIDSLDGILPFYVTMKGVSLYQEGQEVALADEIKSFISPLTAISRPLVLHRVQVTDGWIKGIPLDDKAREWPSLPLGLAIHALVLENISVSNSIPLDIKAMVEFQPKKKGGDFSLDADVFNQSEKEPFLSLQVKGEAETATLYSITHLNNPPGIDASIWITSSTDWITHDMEGEVIGSGSLPQELSSIGKKWEFRTQFDLTPQLDLTLQKLFLESVSLKIEGDAHFSLSSKGLVGEMQADGELLKRPLVFQTHLAVKNTSTLALTELSFDYLDAALQGNVDILVPKNEKQRPLFVGTLEGTFAKLAPLLTHVEALDAPIFGKAKGKLTLATPDQIRQSITFYLEGQDLKYKQLRANTGLLQGNICDFEEGTLKAVIDNANWGDATIEALNAELSFAKQSPTTFQAFIGEQVFLQGSFDHQTNTLVLDADMSAFEVSKLFPTYLEGGEATGTLNLKGPLNELEGSFSLALKTIDFHDCPYEVFPLFDFTLGGTLTDGQLQFEGIATGLGSEPLKAKGEIPIVLELPKFSLEKDKPFSLKLEGSGQVDPLLTFLEGAALICKAKMELDLGISGTINSPTLEGHLVIFDGFVEDLTTGAIFKDLSISMVGRGQELFIDTLKASDLDKGSLEGIGTLVWDTENNFPFTLQLHTQNFDLFTVDPLVVKASGDFTIEGNLQEIEIKGEATISEAHLSLPDKLPVQVPTLEVTYLNPIEEKIKDLEEKQKIDFTWNLLVHIPNNFFIEGRGLSSEWSGSLKIMGEVDDLSYAGDLKAVKGTLAFADRVFTLSSGRVKIEGLKPNQIWMNLQTQADFPSVTVLVGMTGTVEAPEITFSSSPPMATNQILAWILFNSDLNELTPFQACRLAHLLVKLSGTYTGPGIFSSIKEGLGLDVFDITHCDIDAADVTFQVGKYISEGVFVGVNKSISGNTDALTIQTRVFRNFFLQADYGTSINDRASGTGKLILKWYKSY